MLDEAGAEVSVAALTLGGETGVALPPARQVPGGQEDTASPSGVAEASRGWLVNLCAWGRIMRAGGRVGSFRALADFPPLRPLPSCQHLPPSPRFAIPLFVRSG